MRRAIVGVLGGDDQHGQARAVGQMIVRNGWILLTGGDGTSKAKKPQVKDTSMCGAASLNGPRIGILPDNTPLPSSATPRIAKWDQPSRANYLFLKTGVSSKERNVINGQTPDILIALSGGRGTLAEIAFAVAAKKPATAPVAA